jgi:hypothetical protein
MCPQKETMKTTIKKFNKLFVKHYKKTRPDHWIKKPTEYSFSNGLCWYWSYVFVCVYGGEFVNLRNHHMMVRFNGRYYDGNHPEGLDKVPTYFQGHRIDHVSVYGTITEAEERVYFSRDICNIYKVVAEKIIKRMYV